MSLPELFLFPVHVLQVLSNAPYYTIPGAAKTLYYLKDRTVFHSHEGKK